MIVIPKKLPHAKQHVGVNKGLATANNSLNVGEYGLKAVERGDLTSKQLESARVAARKATKRSGKIVFKVVCDTVRSKKPLEVRMGSGKGPRDRFAAKVKPGSVIMEIVGTSREAAMQACKNASHKLPIKTLFIERYDVL